MKKISLKNKLNLTKETLSKLDLKNLKGGDGALAAGMSMIAHNTVYIGCSANAVDGEHMTKRKYVVLP